jgi:hypothetical protein
MKITYEDCHKLFSYVPSKSLTKIMSIQTDPKYYIWKYDY